MMDAKEHGSDRGGFKIRPEQAKVPMRIILQISAMAAVFLSILIIGWSLVISKLQSATPPMQTESVEPFVPVAAQAREPMLFRHEARVPQSCNESDLVCMQVTTLQPSEVLKGVNSLIPTDESKRYLVKITVSPIEDFDR
jgi:hypothetical protein